MRMPGFTAEAALYKSESRYRDGGHVAASTDGAGIQAAMKREDRAVHPMGAVRRECAAGGGQFWGPGPTTSTYGCMYPGGSHGIVCGGQTDEEKVTCDIW